MIVYLWHDTDPRGGYLSVDVHLPDLDHIPASVDEIRLAEVPDDTLAFAQEGGMPVDENHGNDAVWQPFWDDAALVWKRT